MQTHTGTGMCAGPAVACSAAQGLVWSVLDQGVQRLARQQQGAQVCKAEAGEQLCLQQLKVQV